MALDLDQLLRSAPGEPQVDPVAALVAIVGRPEWHERAACRGMDPNDFVTGLGQSTAPARYICAGCPVKAPCLAAARKGDEHGVWGGTSRQERQRAAEAA